MGQLLFKRILYSVLVVIFLIATIRPSCAQISMAAPTPGNQVSLLKGIRVYPEDPLRFDFILDPGRHSNSRSEMTDEAGKLVKYFLAALTVPEKDLWVNLSPYEHDRIIPERFAQTEMGRQTLELDYILKQMTTSLTDPDRKLGNDFWQDIYRRAFEKYGTTQIPVDVFNKVWILPESVDIDEAGGAALVKGLHLKVMLEQDYLTLERHYGIDSVSDVQKRSQQISADVTREVILPILEREVNEGEQFAGLRQICYALALAVWYKGKIKQGIVARQFVDQGKTAGIRHDDPAMVNKVYDRYLEAFKKGAYNYIREEYDQYSQEMIPRRYFSGGLTLKFMKVAVRPLVAGIATAGLFLVNVNMSLAKDQPVLSTHQAGVERVLQQMPAATAGKVASLLDGGQAQVGFARVRKLLGDQGVISFINEDAKAGGGVINKLAVLSVEQFSAMERLKAVHPFIFEIRYSREAFDLVMDKGPTVVQAWADVLLAFSPQDWFGLVSIQKIDLLAGIARNGDLFGDKWLDAWKSRHRIVFEAISGAKANEKGLADIRKGMLRYAGELRAMTFAADGKPTVATLEAYKLFDLYALAYLIQKGYIHDKALKGFLVLTVLFQSDIVPGDDVGAEAVTFKMGEGFAQKILKFSSYGVALTKQHEWGHHAYTGKNFILAEMVGDVNAVALAQVLGVAKEAPGLLQFFLNLADKKHEQHWFARTQGLELINFLSSVDTKTDYELLQDVFHQLLRQHQEHPELLPSKLREQLDGPEIEDASPANGLGFGRIGTDQVMAWVAERYLQRRGLLKEGATKELPARSLELTHKRVIGDQIQPEKLSPEQEAEARREANKKYGMSIAFGVQGVVPFYNGEVSIVSSPALFQYFKGMLNVRADNPGFVKGGIDYDPGNILMNVRGVPGDFDWKVTALVQEGIVFDGLKPVVVGITPVNDLFTALGGKAR
ncbi:MAG: hypothetical protein HQL17_07105 [Candidatus Omnitrophica bacterium]|nr:hypothetical protein [Candidatus Omnitrophota bacterium]